MPTNFLLTFLFPPRLAPEANFCLFLSHFERNLSFCGIVGLQFSGMQTYSRVG